MFPSCHHEEQFRLAGTLQRIDILLVALHHVVRRDPHVALDVTSTVEEMWSKHLPQGPPIVTEQTQGGGR